MTPRHSSALAQTIGRTLIVAVALGSLVVLLDAGAKYSGVAWRAGSLAREPSALEREVSSPDFVPDEFRLSANLPVERTQAGCADPPRAEASPVSDESLDINCARGTTVKAVGDLPRAELLSWPGDWLYHRAARF